LLMKEKKDMHVWKKRTYVDDDSLSYLIA
jgi:hypothetical protein